MPHERLFLCHLTASCLQSKILTIDLSSSAIVCCQYVFGRREEKRFSVLVALSRDPLFHVFVCVFVFWILAGGIGVYR